jgi:hypothetical protein
MGHPPYQFIRSALKYSGGYMKCGFSVAVRLSICLVVAALPMAAQEPRRIDLRAYGYQLDTPPRLLLLVGSSPQIVSVGRNDETTVGFVTRGRKELARRELPSLDLHVLRFAKDGGLLFQGTIPTSSWDHNAIISGSNGTLLIRTDTKLGLYSPALERLAEMDLPSTLSSFTVTWDISPLPNRKEFLLIRYSSIRLLDWSDLRPIRECATKEFRLPSSASNKEVLFLSSDPRDDPDRQMVEITELCGQSHFTYSWAKHREPYGAVLVNDSSILLAGGSSSISLVAGNEVRWTDRFDRKSDVVSHHVEVSADGQTLAIAVIRFKRKGWYEFFDMAAKVKSTRLVVYQAQSGKRISEIFVNPNPSLMFDFGLSPAGDILSILSDGFLEIHPLKDGCDAATVAGGPP